MVVKLVNGRDEGVALVGGREEGVAWVEFSKTMLT